MKMQFYSIFLINLVIKRNYWQKKKSNKSLILYKKLLNVIRYSLNEWGWIKNILKIFSRFFGCIHVSICRIPLISYTFIEKTESFNALEKSPKYASAGARVQKLQRHSTYAKEFLLLCISWRGRPTRGKKIILVTALYILRLSRIFFVFFFIYIYIYFNANTESSRLIKYVWFLLDKNRERYIVH